MNTSTTPTFYWHDYETFGLSPANDRPAQFAGVRTDMDLNEVGAAQMLYCQLPADYLPSPESCLLTGITPQVCQKHGLIEPQFAQVIHHELSTPDTISVGYNSMRFDDEVTRFLFWRNFYPPYKREYENGCSRWDLIDVVRCAYALRPEGVVFPIDETTGKVSLRLEHLTVANGLVHEAAHDALSDVRATIALAKLLKKAQPKLFHFALNLRHKDAVKAEIGYPFDSNKSAKPFLHISGMFGAERRFLAVVFPLAIHPVNKNELIVWDLASNPADLIGLSVDEIRLRMFTSTEELSAHGLTRLPIKTLHINKSPIAISQLKTLNDAQARACGVDWEVIEQHESQAQTHLSALKKIDWYGVFERSFDDVGRIAEQMLYGGSFVPESDYRTVAQVLDPMRVPTGKAAAFQDPRMQELWTRYRARHFPYTLNVDEQAQWQEWRAQQLMGEYDAWLAQLNALGAQYATQPDKIRVLQEVHAYGQALLDEVSELNE